MDAPTRDELIAGGWIGRDWAAIPGTRAYGGYHTSEPPVLRELRERQEEAPGDLKSLSEMTPAEFLKYMNETDPDYMEALSEDTSDEERTAYFERAERELEDDWQTWLAEQSREVFARVLAVRAEAQAAAAVQIPAGVVATPREASSRRTRTAPARGPDDGSPLTEPHLVQQRGWTDRAIARYVAHQARRQRRRFAHNREPWEAAA